MSDEEEGWIQPTRNSFDGERILTSGAREGHNVQYRIEGASKELTALFTCLVHWKNEGDVFYFYTGCRVTRIKVPKETKITRIW